MKIKYKYKYKQITTTAASIVLFILLLSSTNTLSIAQTMGSISTEHERPLEVSLAVSTAVGPHNTWLFDGGLGVNYLVGNNIRLGLEQIGFATSTLLSGTRYGISIAPMVEYHRNLVGSLDGVVGVGLPIQWRFGAKLSTLIGTEPFVRLGLDYNFSDVFSLGLIERVGYVSSSAYLLSSHAIPQGAMIYTTGLAFKFHI